MWFISQQHQQRGQRWSVTAQVLCKQVCVLLLLLLLLLLCFAAFWVQAQQQRETRSTRVYDTLSQLDSLADIKFFT
jgi:hypothetical protein